MRRPSCVPLTSELTPALFFVISESIWRFPARHIQLAQAVKGDITPTHWAIISAVRFVRPKSLLMIWVMPGCERVLLPAWPAILLLSGDCPIGPEYVARRSEHRVANKVYL